MPKTVDEAVGVVCGPDGFNHGMRFIALGNEVARHPLVEGVARNYADLFLRSTREAQPLTVRSHLEGVLLAAIMSGVQIGIEMERSEWA